MVRSGHDIEKAVSAATELFWSKGFDDTSMQEVVEATGFNRYALYSSFGSKRDLFLAALDAYVEFGKSRFEASLEAEPDSVIAALRHFVHGMLETVAELDIGGGRRRQCQTEPEPSAPRDHNRGPRRKLPGRVSRIRSHHRASVPQILS